MNAEHLKNKTYHIEFIDVSLIILILRVFLPIISTLPSVIRYLLLFVQIAFLILAVLSSRVMITKFIPKIIILVIISVSFIIERQNILDNNTIDSIKNLVNFCFPILIGIYLLNTNKKINFNFYIILIILCVFITSITTIYGLTIYPEASRELSTGLSQNSFTLSKYNIASFGFAYSIPVFTFFIVDKVKSNSHHKLFYLLFLVISFIAIVYEQFFIAIIINIFILIISLIKNKKIMILMLLAIIILMYILFKTNLIIKLLNYFADYMNQEGFSVISSKIKNITYFMLGNKEFETSITGRLDKYVLSINGFLIHPIFGNIIFGNLNDNIGSHSEILDYLSAYGLLSLILVLFICYKYFNKIDKKFCMKEKYGIKCYFIFIIMALLNQFIIAYELVFAIFLFPIIYVNNLSIRRGVC